MVIGERKLIMPQVINLFNEDRIKRVFADRGKLHSNSPSPFTVYIEVPAWHAFLQLADEAYNLRRDEASGIFLGYYFKDMLGEFSLCTHFEPGTGRATTSTFCEISVEDQARIASIAKETNTLQLVWVHSHPSFSAFYSPVDTLTLKTMYYAPHQAGLVVDNIAFEYEGFKVSEDNHVCQFRDIFLIDLQSPNSKIANPFSISKQE